MTEPATRAKANKRAVALSPGEKLLLSSDEVAAYCGVGKSRIYQMIQAGEFPRPRRVGKLSRWLRGDVEDWANNTPTDDGGPQPPAR